MSWFSSHHRCELCAPCELQKEISFRSGNEPVKSKWYCTGAGEPYWLGQGFLSHGYAASLTPTSISAGVPTKAALNLCWYANVLSVHHRDYCKYTCVVYAWIHTHLYVLLYVHTYVYTHTLIRTSTLTSSLSAVMTQTNQLSGQRDRLTIYRMNRGICLIKWNKEQKQICWFKEIVLLHLVY